MKKIIFLDLDGTLWTFEKIPSSALEAIELARKNGHKIYINTGRTRCEIPQFLLDMNLDGYCFGAGSEIIIDNKQVLFKEYIKLDRDKSTFTSEKNRERMRQFHTDNRMGNRFLSFPDISTITDDDYNQVMKVSIHFDSLSQREEILRQIPKHLTFTNFMHLGGEITHSEYNKATAIQFVKNYYKEIYETVAMGDSENDLLMLEYADISIAMGNGVKEVKEKADYVTDKIDNDGLYKAFKHLKLF